MSVDALRHRLASLGSLPRRAAPGPRFEPPRRIPPHGFEPVENDYGVAWRWAEVLSVGQRLQDGASTVDPREGDHVAPPFEFSALSLQGEEDDQ